MKKTIAQLLLAALLFIGIPLPTFAASELNELSFYSSITAHYKAEDNTDSKGDYDLTNTNSVGFSAGKFNNAFDFGAPGSNKRMERSSGVLTDPTQFSMGCWFKKDGTFTGTQQFPFFITDIYSGADQVEVEAAYEHNNGSPRIRWGLYKYGIGQEFIRYTSATFFDDNQYHYIGLARGDGSAELYKDGSELDTVSSSGGGTTASDQEFAFGGYNGGGGFDADDCFVSDIKLSAANFAEIFNEGAGPVVSLNELADKRVIQRVGNSGTLPISGSYTGSVTAIQARVINAETSAVVVDWTTIDASPSGGTYSGNLSVPHGGWYLHQVRDSVETTSVDNGVNKFGVGDNVLFIGQSNIQNMSNTMDGNDQLTPCPVCVKYDGSWATLVGDGAVQTANDLNAARGVPIGILNYAAPSSVISTWQPGQSNFDNAVNAGNAVGISGISWTLGENNAISNISYATFRSALEGVISNFRSSLSSSTMPFVMNTIGRYTQDITHNQSFTDVRQATKDVAASTTNVYIASNNTTFGIKSGDTIHYDQPGYVKQGKLIAQTFLDIVASTNHHVAPTITHYHPVSSTTIDVYVDHNDGTNFTPTLSITGFEVIDNGSPATISSANKQDASTIRLTLASSYSGPLTVRYQWGQNPDVSSAVFDNSSLALPLAPNYDIPYGDVPPQAIDYRAFFNGLFYSCIHFHYSSPLTPIYSTSTSETCQ